MHTIGNWIGSFFSWPNGGVWSNLLASVIWTLPALRWHHKRIKEHVDRALAAGPVEPKAAAAAPASKEADQR